MTLYTGYIVETPFEQECRLLGLDATQVATALKFGRDMIAEVRYPEECNDNGFGNCGCHHCTGGVAPVVDNKPIPF